MDEKTRSSIVSLTVILTFSVIAAGLLAWVWNCAIAWEFNLPEFGYWVWFAGIWGLRFTKKVLHGIGEKK